MDDYILSGSPAPRARRGLSSSVVLSLAMAGCLAAGAATSSAGPAAPLGAATQGGHEQATVGSRAKPSPTPGAEATPPPASSAGQEAPTEGAADAPACAPLTLVADDAYLDVALERISAARESILLSMYLFKPGRSAKNRAKRLLDEIVAAADRGLRVQAVLERAAYDDGISETNERVARVLLAHGAKVWFDDRRQRNHSKVLVVDDRYVLLGSHNLTQSALQYNRELSVLIDSIEVASSAASFIRSIAEEGRPVTPEQLRTLDAPEEDD